MLSDIFREWPDCRNRLRHIYSNVPCDNPQLWVVFSKIKK